MSIKFITAQEAAALIKHNDNVGFSGFTHAGSPKLVPIEIAKLAEAEHAKGNPFKIGMFTGASTGEPIDGYLARAKAVKFRTPYQTSKDMRNAINQLDHEPVPYYDMHLSLLAQELRYGFLGKVDVAIIEACDVTADGQIVPTTGVGISPTIASMAKIVIVELNKQVPAKLRGIHDLCELSDPPHRDPIAITKPTDRIGKEYIQVDPAKIYVVETDIESDGGGFAPVDEVTAKIGENVANFFVSEMKNGRIPSEFLPIQSGVGNIANAVLAAMANNDDIPNFDVYTEVIQDAVIDMIRNGKVNFASGCSLTVSNEKLDEVFADLDFFKEKIVLRPSELSNNPEIVRRLGIIGINTAIEVDVFGNVNSTHVMGTNMMNGIGGSGDFTRSAYLSIFVTPSTAKGGAISAIVPKVSHADHSEHSVKIIVSEYGIADLRGKSPLQRAKEIIFNCAHPDYRELLWEYVQMQKSGHTPQSIYACFEFHKEFLEKKSMKAVSFEK